jgi:hypothetical protein
VEICTVLESAHRGMGFYIFLDFFLGNIFWKYFFYLLKCFFKLFFGFWFVGCGCGVGGLGSGGSNPCKAG